MQLLISLSALLLSVMLVQMGIGALRPFDSILGAAFGITSVDIGLIASGYFVDFAGQISAHSLIGVLTPASYISYNVLAMIMFLALIPLAVTLSREPSLLTT